jgi:hypothetical protein
MLQNGLQVAVVWAKMRRTPCMVEATPGARNPRGSPCLPGMQGAAIIRHDEGDSGLSAPFVRKKTCEVSRTHSRRMNVERRAAGRKVECPLL